MHGVVTETSQKPRLGGDSTTWVARATGSVTAFACALFPHRNMAWEYLLDPAIDMLGHGDRMPREKQIPDRHVIDTPNIYRPGSAGIANIGAKRESRRPAGSERFS